MTHEFVDMGQAERFAIASDQLSRLLWERKQFREELLRNEYTCALIEKGHRVVDDVRTWLEQQPEAPVEHLSISLFQTLANRLLVEKSSETTEPIVDVASAFLEMPVVALSLIVLVPANSYAEMCGEAGSLVIEMGFTLDIVRAVVEVVAEVYLSIVLSLILDHQLPFPQRYTVQVLHSDPLNLCTFTFVPPEWATPESFQEYIEQWLNQLRSQIQEKYYLKHIAGKRVGKLEETIRRNTTWLYEHLVEQRSINQIVRELSGFNQLSTRARRRGTPDRRTEVKRSIRSAQEDLLSARRATEETE